MAEMNIQMMNAKDISKFESHRLLQGLRPQNHRSSIITLYSGHPMTKPMVGGTIFVFCHLELPDDFCEEEEHLCLSKSHSQALPP